MADATERFSDWIIPRIGMNLFVGVGSGFFSFLLSSLEVSDTPV
jgi:hypothetical protein